MTAAGTVQVTGQRQKQAWDQHQIPPVEEVRPGLWSIPVPMGDNPLRYSLCYVFMGRKETVLVDPGWPSEVSFGALESGLRTAGRTIDDVSGVLVTHAHHDHYGLACQVRDASGAWVAMHRLDAALLVKIGANYSAILEERRQWLRRCGASRAEVLRHGGDLELIERSAVSGGPDRGIGDGELIRVGDFEIEAVWTPGHTPGHMTFLERRHRILLSGDHLLPRITPNISAFAGHDVGLLGSYLDSLRKIRDLDVVEVLPGHEYRFAGMVTRADVIANHHERRLAEIVSAIGSNGWVSAWDLSERLTWSRSWNQLESFSRRAAVGETLAHLHLLHSRGEVAHAEDGLKSKWSRKQGQTEVPS